MAISSISAIINDDIHKVWDIVLLLINIVCGEAIYRNKIVGHNIINTPELTFDINEADFVISQYEDLFKVLSFQNKRYAGSD